MLNAAPFLVTKRWKSTCPQIRELTKKNEKNDTETEYYTTIKKSETDL